MPYLGTWNFRKSTQQRGVVCPLSKTRVRQLPHYHTRRDPRVRFLLYRLLSVNTRPGDESSVPPRRLIEDNVDFHREHQVTHIWQSCVNTHIWTLICCNSYMNIHMSLLIYEHPYAGVTSSLTGTSSRGGVMTWRNKTFLTGSGPLWRGMTWRSGSFRILLKHNSGCGHLPRSTRTTMNSTTSSPSVFLRWRDRLTYRGVVQGLNRMGIPKFQLPRRWSWTEYSFG